MKFGEGRGIKTGVWFPNEIFRDSDINNVGEATYQNIVDLLGTLVKSGVYTGDDPDYVLAGLQLDWSTVLTMYLRAGMVVSPQGTYLTGGSWGFSAAAGELFGVVVPEDVAVAVLSGEANDRIDILEVRPVQTEYDSEPRNFKDPVTGLVTTSPVHTKIEYGYEFAVRKGNGASALAYEQTTFTVNSATVGSDIAGKYILFSTVYADYYVWYNTGASSDPSVAGRTGVEVSINAGDDDDAIALATRTALAGISGIGVSGAAGQIILTGTTYTNLTDATNGDMGSFFDTIAIVQGNGAVAKTSGWVKVAEITVPASASSINQSNIKDVRDADQWNADVEGTRLLRSPDIQDFLDARTKAEGRTSLDVYSKSETAQQVLEVAIDAELTVHDSVVAGDLIVLKPGADGGRYRKAYALSPTLTQITELVNTGDLWAPVWLTENKLVIVTDDLNPTARYARPFVLTLGADGTWTIGSIGPSLTGDANRCYPMRTYRLDDTHFVMVYVDGQLNGLVKAVVGTEASGSVSWGTPVTLSSVACYNVSLPFLWGKISGDWYFVVDYNRFTVNRLLYSNSFKVDGSTYALTAGTELTVEGTDSCISMYVTRIKWGTFFEYVVHYYWNDTDDNFVARRTLVTDITTLTFGGTTGEQILSSGNTGFTGSDGKPVIRVDGVDYLVGFHGTPNGIGVLQSRPTAYVFSALANGGVGGIHNANVCTVSGDGASRTIYSLGCNTLYGVLYRFIVDKAPHVDTYAFTNQAMIVGELARYNEDAVFVIMRENTTFDAYFGIVEFVPNFVGVALETIASGSSGRVRLKGVVGNLSGLVIGKEYWLKPDGTLSAWSANETDGLHRATRIGRAISTTEMLLEGGW